MPLSCSRLGGRAVALASVVALGACDGPQSALDPGGVGARDLARLTWLLLAISAVVFVIVLALLLVALLRRRAVRDPIAERTRVERAEEDARATRWVLVGGVLVPALVLAGVFVYAMPSLGAFSTMPDDAPVVEVVGHQWWWRVRYHGGEPAALVESANELHLPVGRPVRLHLTSTDVIHSFWVPGLQGKMDLIPGRTTVMWLQADTVGRWRGQCAEFCGLQHANMALVVVAHPAAEWPRWLAAQRAGAAPPADSITRRGQHVFLERGCGFCHRVRGTMAAGAVGPDLTHVGSRLTLAAGTLPNTLGHLAGWIGNPQVVKPGSRMPRVPLEPPEQQALLAYLRSLR